jgi:hypothetical protein
LAASRVSSSGRWFFGDVEELVAVVGGDHAGFGHVAAERADAGVALAALLETVGTTEIAGEPLWGVAFEPDGGVALGGHGLAERLLDRGALFGAYVGDAHAAHVAFAAGEDGPPGAVQREHLAGGGLEGRS